jgi:hypothetical protein
VLEDKDMHILKKGMQLVFGRERKEETIKPS